MSGAQAGKITTDILSTQVPQEVAEPHGANSFAIDGIPLEKGDGSVAEVYIEDDQYPLPTREEQGTLRKVSGSVPYVIWLLCLVEFAERASYYGASTVFSNFIQYPLPIGGNGAGAPPAGTQETAGALGRGLQFANAFVLLFQFLAYVVPILGAWIADTRLGRFTTILIGVLVCFVAHIILIVAALPSVLQAGRAAAPFILGLLILAIGAGLFKPNIAPTLLDQYDHQKPYTKVLKSGEKVIIDPEATVQRLMLIFYGLINVGAFYQVACTYAEKRIGYWLAFLLPGIIFMLLPFILAYLYKRLIKVPPSSSELSSVFKILIVALRETRGQVWKKDFFHSAKPSRLAEKGITSFRGQPIGWTDSFVEDVVRTFDACSIFLYLVIWNLNDGGIGSVATNQGSTMTTNGAPNDLLNNFNPITIIVAVPILSHFIYPLLRKRNIKFGRISRMTFGFTLAWLSGIAGTVLQYYVYKTNPCGFQASSCANQGVVSPISIWWQVPNVSLGALSEIFCNVTAYELAYARSPKSMKALVMAICLFMTALSSAFGEILTPVIQDPYLIWIWGAPTVALFIQTIIFWFKYRHLDDDAFMTYHDDMVETELRRDDSKEDGTE